jgi:repressor LexA
MGCHLKLSSKTQPSGLWLAGRIVAGFPSPAEEELRDILSFDEYLVPRPKASFILHVTGDSMIGAGIMPGDLVIIEKGRSPKNGDIVIAEVDGSYTMKYFRREQGRIILEAANPKYPALTPRCEMRLIGVVVACVRKYAL